MKQKTPFKNMPKMQAKKFAQLRREKTRAKLAKVIRRWLGTDRPEGRQG